MYVGFSVMPNGLKPMRIALLGASLDTTNMGVGALAAGSIQCLLRGYPQADIRLLDYAKETSVQRLRLADRDLSVPVINIRFSWRLYLPNNIVILVLLALLSKAIPSDRWRKWILSSNATLREIEQMDLFTSIAGGDSFSDIYGMERLLYVSLPQLLVLQLGKKLIVLPQTIGPFRGKATKAIARYIFSRADRIYSRDYRGLEEMKALIGKSQGISKLAFCYDVGFVLDAIAPDRIEILGLPCWDERVRPTVGLNVSGLLLMGGYSRDNMFRLRAGYQELIDEISRLLIRKKGADILLVPHVFGTDPSSEADTIACQRVFERLKHQYPARIGLLRGQLNQNEVKFVIGKCDFFIGSRMHACIAAVSQHIPAVCLAYSDKFIGVMETMEMASTVADMRRLGVEEILDVVDRCFDDRTALRAQLQQKMPQVKSSVLNLLVGPPEAAPIDAGRDLVRSSPFWSASESAFQAQNSAVDVQKFGR